MAILLFAMLGLIAGAVVNAAADRLPHARGLGRGNCLVCERTLPWLYSFRLLLFLLRRHRCPHCNTTLSYRGVAVEVALAGLFVYAWLHFGPGSRLLAFTVYLAIFVLIFVVDIEHRRVLNKVVLPSAFLAIAVSWLIPPFSSEANGWSGLLNALFGGLIGLGAFLGIALAKPGAMGMGDVKLAGLIGLIAGVPGIMVALAVAIFSGGISALALLLCRRVGAKQYIPYAPFLTLGGLMVMLYGAQIWDWYVGRLN